MIEELSELVGHDVSRETFDSLRRFQELVIEENRRQNLVSAATIDEFWRRHIVDSAQLIRLAPEARSWADIGSGAGLPGIVIAILSDTRVTMIEPRKLRAEFLLRVVDALALNATVHRGKAESVRGEFEVVSARAVAKLDRLFEISQHFSTGKTVYLFPKGKTVETELADARRTWQGSFHVEQSVTSEDSNIIVATNVRPRKP